MAAVLYLNPYGTIGGAERSLIELLSAIDRDAYPPVVVLGAPGPLEAALRERGIEVHVEPFPATPLHRLLDPRVFWAQARAAWRLRRLVAARRVRILHCGDVLGLLLLLPSLSRGTRLVQVVNYLGGRPRRLLMNLVAFLAADVVVAVSDDQRRELREQLFGLDRRTTTVRPGIHPDEFATGDRAAFRRELGVGEGTPLVGLVARYDTWKGHEVFLQAAARVHARRPDVGFVMVGDAINRGSFPHLERYRRHVLRTRAALALEGVVQMIGHRDDVASVLAGFDVLVCPSEREPFGMVVIEALAAGTPVIASDSGGPAEILEDGRAGLLFPTADATALADAIVGLLDDRPLRQALARAGRERVREAFERDRYAREMESLYARLA